MEIGCGTGRITRQLASCFRHVTALDVSPGQLETARRLLQNVVHNVEFTLVSTPHLPVDDGMCDGVFSCEVFQHLDPAVPLLRDYISEAYRVLAQGGTFCFQLPVRGIQGASILASPARNRLLGVLRHLGRRRMMIYQQFSAPLVLGLLSQSGFRFVSFMPGGRRATTATSLPAAVPRANPGPEQLPECGIFQSQPPERHAAHAERRDFALERGHQLGVAHPELPTVGTGARRVQCRRRWIACERRPRFRREAAPSSKPMVDAIAFGRHR